MANKTNNLEMWKSRDLINAIFLVKAEIDLTLVTGNKALFLKLSKELKDLEAQLKGEIEK